MNSNLRNRRGSALLIVLGFVAFMVVSAVSFAVYMRTERVASSGFHRTVTARELVKAGLARAMQEIDYRVGDSPFPGLDTIGRGGDRWPNHVLSPGCDSLDLDPERTYPVLCLEALSYLPPALVNEVRARARETVTAMWRPLAFEAGRYAFVAVNVSDMFDVNKVRFSDGRSSAPNGHVSLGYLYQNRAGNQMLVDPAQLAPLDDFLDRSASVSYRSDVPFISMADFNVALFGASSLSSVMRSPFYDYLSGSDPTFFYAKSGSSEIGTGPAATPPAKAMLFTVGSWSQPTNAAEIIDMARRENQPFLESAYGNESAGFLQFAKTAFTGAGKAFDEVLKNDLNVITIADLYDYLDEDDQPVSLAIPNVERVPMIAAVNAAPLVNTMSLALDKKETQPSAGSDGRMYRTTSWTLKPAGNGIVSGVLLYPFKHGEPPGNFKVQACAKICFVDPDCCVRSRESLSPTRADWPDSKRVSTDPTGITLFSAMKPVNAKLAKDEEETAIDFIVEFPNLGEAAADLANLPVLSRKVAVRLDSGTGQYVEDPSVPPKISASLTPYTKNAGDVAYVGAPLAAVNEQPSDPTRDGKTFEPRVFVWVRVVGDNGLTVDLSPASLADDSLAGVTQTLPGSAGSIGATFGIGTGCSLLAVRPESNPANMLVFESGCKEVKLGSATPLQNSASCFVAIDPRYNHCAEDFIAFSDSGYGKARYLQDVRDVLGKDGRDPDVFMAASNQEYLQSIGELAFLPRLGDLGSGSLGGEYIDRGKAMNGAWYASTFGAMDKARTHADQFWRTYRLYRQGTANSDGIFEYYSDLVNGFNDCRVNPYSDLLNVQLAVTANTPVDYNASSTNEQYSSVAKVSKNDPAQRLRHSFNELPGTEAKLRWNDVTNITAVLFRELRAKATAGAPDSWEKAMEELEWYDDTGNGDRLFGVTLAGDSDPLDGIDRKMMYSWWHDSMACRQQLFLVFVRAEATPFGAPSSAESKETGSSQVGARAVALVWRDPVPDSGAAKIALPDTIYKSDRAVLEDLNGNTGAAPFGSRDRYVPHRMRVLFYHQFE